MLAAYVATCKEQLARAKTLHSWPNFNIVIEAIAESKITYIKIEGGQMNGQTVGYVFVLLSSQIIGRLTFLTPNLIYSSY